VPDPTIRVIPDDLEQWAEPYPVLERLREAGPVQRVRLRAGLIGWIVTRQAEVAAALGDQRFSSDSRYAEAALDQAAPLARRARDDRANPSMLSTDPPEHTRLRRPASRAFTGRRVERLRPRIQQITDSLLDTIAPRGDADLVEDLAFPLPVAVICELLGVPFEDREQFRVWSAALFRPLVDQQVAVAASEARTALREYLAPLIAARRSDPTDDLLSVLVGEENRALSHSELVTSAVLLLVAGHETTVNLIGTGAYLLLRHPDQLARIRARPELLPDAVEEVLRYDGPVMLGVIRYTTEDVSLGGRTIPAGEVVFLSTGAANRDPDRFDRPDTFDVSRTDNGHLAFGHGVHFCPGAALARLEGQIAIGSLFGRFPDLALADPDGPPCWRPSMLRGLATLPVTFSPRP
jgi:cytochrome P450